METFQDFNSGEKFAIPKFGMSRKLEIFLCTCRLAFRGYKSCHSGFALHHWEKQCSDIVHPVF